MAYLIFIHIGVQQLFVATVYDCGPIAGSKDMGDTIAVEGFETDGLAAQTELLPVTQLTCSGNCSLHAHHQQNIKHVTQLQAWHK